MIAFIICICLIIVAMAVWTTCIILRKRWNNIVLKHSKLIEELNQLNLSTEFDWSVQASYACSYDCESLTIYKKMTPDKYVVKYIQRHVLELEPIVKAIEENKKQFPAYEQSYHNLKTSITKEECKKLKIPYNTFLKIEKDYYHSKKLNPTIDTVLQCSITYTSPAGRNHYSKEELYQFDDIKNYIKQANFF